jgi:hypothetical protein
MKSVQEWIEEKIENGYTITDLKDMYAQYIEETKATSNFASYERVLRKFKPMNMGSRAKESFQTEENFTTGEKTFNSVSSKIKTIQDLRDKAKLSTAEWDETYAKVNTWYDTSEDGKEYYQIKATFKKKVKRDYDFTDIMPIIKETIQTYKPNLIKLPKRKIIKSDKMLELAPMDHHLGQLSWAEESGENYDLHIAQDLYIESFRYLVDKSLDSFELEKLLFVVGSDFFNVNDRLGMTVKGTPQAEDGRWQKTFTYGVNTVIDCIEYARNKGLALEVMFIPGNHDLERLYYLSVCIEQKYCNEDDVTIDSRPLTRKYFSYGKCLIGFAHGDGEAKNTRPLIMSREAKEHWANAEYIEIHTGHLHAEKGKAYTIIQEEQAIIERVLSALVARDDWHTHKGYSHLRKSQAFIWDKNRGLDSIFMFNP